MRRRRIGIAALVAVVILMAIGLAAAVLAGRGSGDTATTQVGALATTTPAAGTTSPTTAMSPTTTRRVPPTTTPVSATTTSAPRTTTSSTTPAVPKTALAFDASRAMAHIKKFSVDIGVRTGGTKKEAEAAAYARDYLESLGYSVNVTPVPLPNGRVSHNVVAVKNGSSPSTILIGAHIDSEAPAPGANDNASGAATVLELARDLKSADTTATIQLVLFGTEEIIDSHRDHDHFGSRAFVKTASASEKANLVGMVSVDMVAVGDTFTVGTMGRGPQQLSGMLQAYAKSEGLAPHYNRDTSIYGQGDYEPFELAGYPAAWVEWGPDTKYHTAADTYQRCQPAVLGRTGKMLLGFLSSLSSTQLDTLKNAKG
jgi:Zn-dependent M28 family amino/carboxypeptidase